ncbi:MAG TPA: hypothetical protein VF898_03590 [Chloroflexota bacterium]
MTVHGMDGANQPGLALVLELIHEQARHVPCRGCGQALQDSAIEIRGIEIDRIVVELVCGSCGATSTVAATPSTEPGTAVVR